MIRFGIVLFEGFDELDAIAPWEVLRNAEKFGAPFQTTLFALAGAGTIEASNGLRVVVDRAEPSSFDWIVVPGGSWLGRGPRGVWAEIQRGALPAALRQLRAGGKSIASVCTGAMILSAAGITQGRAAITHSVAKEALAKEGANVIEARVVDDGDLVTAGGVTSGIDLALWLTERLASAEIAARVAVNLEHHRVGGVHHGPGSDRGAGSR